jgi:hypothetical protein
MFLILIELFSGPLRKKRDQENGKRFMENHILTKDGLGELRV